MSADFRYESLEVAGSGESFIGVAGEALADRQLVRFNAAGQLVRASAAAVGTLPCVGITLAAAVAGQSVEVLIYGFLGLSTWTWSAGGARLFVSDTVGTLAEAAGTVTQRVGVALSATQIFFDAQGIDTAGAIPGAHAATHEPAGADEVNDIDILNTGVLLSAHETRHIQGGADDIDSALDARAIALVNQGDIPYRGAVANTLAALGPGVAGQALLTQGVGADPIWGAPTPGLHAASHILAATDPIIAALDARAIALTAQGDIAYRSGVVNTLARLAPGVAGQALLTQGAGANPIWGVPAPAGHEATHVQGGTDDIDSALDARAIALANQGDIVYRAAGANTLAALAPGVAGQFLQTQGAGANPIWAAGGAGADPNDQFFAAPSPDGSIGPYATKTMLNGVDTTIKQTIQLPNNWTDSWGVYIEVIPEASGDLRRTITTNFCAPGEVYTTHSDTIAAGVQAVTLNEREQIDITAALTGASAGDMVGVQFLRDTFTSALDTVEATVHYLGITLVEA